MPNYILIYYGRFPEYTSSAVTSILASEENPNIYLCSNESIDHLKIKNENVYYIDLNQIESSNLRKVKQLNLYNSNLTQISNLLNTSLWRTFVLSDIAKHLNISSYIHFDCDVIIFEPFEAYSKYINTSKIYMTEISKNSFVFSYMYCGDVDAFDEIISKIFLFITRKNFLLRRNLMIKFYQFFTKNRILMRFISDDSFKYNEMRLIHKINKKINKILRFNTTPKLDSEFIFDAGDYGFLLEGHFYDSGVSNIYSENIAGQYILKNNPNLIFVDKKPNLEVNKKFYKIVNLHIHSKNLEKFIF